MENDSGPLNESWWYPIYEIFVHIFIGSILFLVIAFVAIGLGIIIKAWTAHGVDAFIKYGLYYAKYLLFAADLILFSIHIFRKTIDAGKLLWKS